MSFRDIYYARYRGEIEKFTEDWIQQSINGSNENETCFRETVEMVKILSVSCWGKIFLDRQTDEVKVLVDNLNLNQLLLDDIFRKNISLKI